MIDPFTAWSRMAAAGVEMQRNWTRGVQTMQASASVIAARTDMLRDAATRPMDADVLEIGRMVPEKVDAFGRSMAAVARDTMAMHAAWTIQMQRVGLMMLSGKPPTLSEASLLAGQLADYALGSVSAGARLGSHAIAPVHSAATGNARRLRRARSKAVRR